MNSAYYVRLRLCKEPPTCLFDMPYRRVGNYYCLAIVICGQMGSKSTRGERSNCNDLRVQRCTRSVYFSSDPTSAFVVFNSPATYKNSSIIWSDMTKEKTTILQQASNALSIMEHTCFSFTCTRMIRAIFLSCALKEKI